MERGSKATHEIGTGSCRPIMEKTAGKDEIGLGQRIHQHIGRKKIDPVNDVAILGRKFSGNCQYLGGVNQRCTRGRIETKPFEGKEAGTAGNIKKMPGRRHGPGNQRGKQPGTTRQRQGETSRSLGIVHGRRSRIVLDE